MRKEFLLHHLTAFILAALLSIVIIAYTPLKPYFIDFDKGASPLAQPDTATVFFANYDNGYCDELAFRNALHHGNAITLIGSSELTNKKMKGMPYNFFNAHKIPCIGFGHEGNQDLAITAQLAVLHNELKDSKIIIILSPGWFEGGYSKGTSLESFLEFVNERFLYLLYFDNEIPAETKNYIYSYVDRNYKDINSPSAILKLMYFTAQSNKSILNRIVFAPYCFFYQMYCEKKQKLMTDLFYKNKSYVPFTEEPYKVLAKTSPDSLNINWDSVRSNAIEAFKTISNNNNLGIENNYYNKYMQKAAPSIVVPVKTKDNTEFKDFVALLRFLKTFNCRPLFVMQPFNPLAFSNMHDIEPIEDSIINELKKNNFPYMNLQVSAKDKYVKGTLNDYQHLGDVGWYQIDQKAYELFVKNKLNEKAAIHN
ncbi:MAG TPA: D-alanyl-lipoteichoic acid biosynthesis protein DltD [Bacteroidia bacterium]|jgi:D-alanine transfer protein|nr:D-alanyl-lipoteichoic acid biosynthesis protein DltD [Bacteroidia bacterium]